ncbi:signal transduction histidine kinase [Fictibacillus macauensis ZFHKF-1]|uniref:Sensor histidine kinase n=1 Tax=Fictibacillus macauensis ZFHKF-1 TaxID=1196324 RepID=I8UGL6_9BACL|nr:sensor histidine kinase [Fictibacillus macauensis]EIT86020.1 signal transduction histidine kinase [Fictibacillus macauensis ZFHKF-1]
MKLTVRLIIVWTCFSLLLCGILFASVYVIFGKNGVIAYWHYSLFGLPLFVLLLLACLVMAIFLGTMFGSMVARQARLLSLGIQDVAKGKAVVIPEEQKTAELQTLWEEIKQAQLHVQEQVKASQKLANDKAEHQEKLVQEMVSRERQRLARELHDSVSQQLFAASMLLSAVNETGERNQQLALVEQMIHQSQVEMRALLLHLRPAALKGKSLQDGMKELLLEFVEKSAITLKQKIEPIVLSKGIEDHLFRIFQEGISNMLRHAKADYVEVLLLERDGFVILRVADNGVGFLLEEARTSSYGLDTMQERALEIGGTFKVVSLPGKGTRLEVKVPYMRKEVR